MNEEDKLIEEQFKKLPEPVQRALQVIPWKSSVKEIALLNNLSLEQVSTVERETMFILYGFESPDDYVANIMRETQIDETIATAIAEAVNDKIFKEIALKAEEPPTETKVEALEDLSHRTINNEMAPPPAPVSVPPPSAQGSGVAMEIAPANLPMVEVGEKVHDVPPMKPEEKAEIKSVVEAPVSQPKPVVPVPNYRYEKGKDPYREPLV